MGRKIHKDQVQEVKIREPESRCATCDGPHWIRRLPRGDWICSRCNPYAAMEARLHKFEEFTVWP